jgi:hypothetical protein
MAKEAKRVFSMIRYQEQSKSEGSSAMKKTPCCGAPGCLEILDRDGEVIHLNRERLRRVADELRSGRFRERVASESDPTPEEEAELIADYERRGGKVIDLTVLTPEGLDRYVGVLEETADLPIDERGAIRAAALEDLTPTN